MEFKKEDLVKSLEKSLGEKCILPDVERYAGYCYSLLVKKDKSGKPKNSWMLGKGVTVEYLDILFRRVQNEGLVFDGEDIALTSQGIQYNYQAWKRKVLMIYPESKIDINLIYKGDAFECSKENGKVFYKHILANPFEHDDNDIIGGYMVIRNSRGEFLNTLSAKEIAKRRAVAKTDYIWKAWFAKMCLKTVARDGFSFHFKDDFKGMITEDNKMSDVEVEPKPEIEVLKGKIVDALEVYQDDDKEEIRSMCNQKSKDNQFTVKFAKEVLAKIQKDA